MGNTTTSPNMGMVIPNPEGNANPELGPAWAQEIFNLLMNTVDPHNHAAGNGAKITPAGMDVSVDLSFLGSDGNNHNATQLRSARLVALQAAIGVDPNDRRALFAVGNELYYIDGAGNVVQLTSAGSVNAAAGSIGGLVAPAAVTYNVGSKTFFFVSAANTPAEISAGSVAIGQQVLNGLAVTFIANAAMAAGYSVTWPAALPAAKTAMLVDQTGAMSFAAIDFSTVGPGFQVGYARSTFAGGNGANNVNVSLTAQASYNIAGSQVYTAKKATNRIKVRAKVNDLISSATTPGRFWIAIFIDGNAASVYSQVLGATGNSPSLWEAGGFPGYIEFEAAAGDTAAHTYKVGVANDSNTNPNQQWAGQGFWDSFIEVTEISQ